jgi:hypothetical protein
MDALSTFRAARIHQTAGLAAAQHSSGRRRETRRNPRIDHMKIDYTKIDRLEVGRLKIVRRRTGPPAVAAIRVSRRYLTRLTIHISCSRPAATNIRSRLSKG